MHRVEKTLQVLIGAFMRGKLDHHQPCSCAVGNLLLQSNPINMTDRNGVKDFQECWTDAVVRSQVTPRSCELFAPTNYSIEEMRHIEAKFEKRIDGEMYFNSANDPDSFKGLSAVFDLLVNDLDKDYFESRPAIQVRGEEVLVGVG